MCMYILTEGKPQQKEFKGTFEHYSVIQRFNAFGLMSILPALLYPYSTCSILT